MELYSCCDDKNMIALCQKEKSWQRVNELEKDCVASRSRGDAFFGAAINPIGQLSGVYGKPFFSLSFLIKNFSRGFREEDSALAEAVIHESVLGMRRVPGYYILKVPSHAMAVLDCVNRIEGKVFAGGTVCYAMARDAVGPRASNVLVRRLDARDLGERKSRLLELGQEGFRDYFGQYHIAEFTRSKAGRIYRNWVNEYIEAEKGVTYGAFAGDALCGFLNCEAGNYWHELVLSAVDSERRGLGIYDAMIRAGTSDGLSQGKIVTTSTQFDNFAVQRAWSEIGFKPYYSFYLFHYSTLGPELV